MKMPERAATAKAWGRRVVNAGLMAGLALSACWAQAQSAIQAVTCGIQGGTEIVRIQLSEPLKAVPSSFTVQSPARIALDFAGVADRKSVV